MPRIAEICSFNFFLSGYIDLNPLFKSIKEFYLMSGTFLLEGNMTVRPDLFMYDLLQWGNMGTVCSRRLYVCLAKVLSSGKPNSVLEYTRNVGSTLSHSEKNKKIYNINFRDPWNAFKSHRIREPGSDGNLNVMFSKNFHIICSMIRKHGEQVSSYT